MRKTGSGRSPKYLTEHVCLRHFQTVKGVPLDCLDVAFEASNTGEEMNILYRYEFMALFPKLARDFFAHSDVHEHKIVVWHLAFIV